MSKITNPIYCEILKSSGKSMRQAIKDGDYNFWDSERIRKGWYDSRECAYCGTEEMLLKYADNNTATMWLIPAKKAIRLGATLF